jgi:hypothetical protein
MAISGILVAVIICSHHTSVWAQEKQMDGVAVAGFAGGLATAFLIHEAAHALAAGMTDTSMDWDIGNYNQPIGFTENADSDFDGFVVNASGLLVQVAGSEIILRTEKIDKNTAFVRGMMTWNILNPILYALDYWVFRISNDEEEGSYKGDLEGIEHYSNERTAHGFALSIAAIAGWQGYRFLKTQPWAPEWIKGETHNLGIAPLRSGGVMMAYRYNF